MEPIDVPQITTDIIDQHASDLRPGDSYEAAARGGVVAVIHKATEGRDFVDKRYSAVAAEAKAAGLLLGLYHFGNNTDPATQVDHFLAHAAAHPEALLVLDHESNEDSDFGTMTVEKAVAFVRRVHEKTGRWPVYYSYDHILRKHMATASAEERDVLGRCPLWLAAYGPNPLTLVPPRPWASWWLQQYTNGAAGPADQVRFTRSTPGLRKPTDRSVYRGTVDQLRVDWKTVGRLL